MALVLLSCANQVAPPLSVRRIVPPVPTAIPFEESAKEEARRFLSPATRLCARQVRPLSSVRATVAIFPTATKRSASGIETACKLFPVGMGFCQNQPGSALEALQINSPRHWTTRFPA